jgi:flagellar motility protein MotE (MotC chaperone)
MIRLVRDLRLIPIALIASACLLVLKLATLAFDGSRWLAADNSPARSATVVHTTPDASQPPGGHLSWAQQMFNFPGTSGSSATPGIAPPPIDPATAHRLAAENPDPDITGSVKEPPAPNGKATPPAKAVPAATPVNGIVIPTRGVAMPHGAEREILERLQQRREELDKRSRELDIRESLVKAAENRIAAQLAELKEVEGRIKVETQQKDEMEAGRFKGLVTMYENMKPREAARIFNGLDIEVLLKVASQINPRTMADIMAQMSPDMAERLTVEMASKAQRTEKNDPAALPKIVGHRTMP